MIQKFKVPSIKPKEMSVIPGTHIVQGESLTSKNCPLASTCVLWHMHTHIHAHIHIHTQMNE